MRVKRNLWLFAVVVLLIIMLVSFTHAQLGTISAVVSRDTVTIWNRDMVSNCASRFVFDVSILQDSIAVIERDTTLGLVHCVCRFDLSVTIAGLQSGHYVAAVYRRHRALGDTNYFVGQTTFTISGLGGVASYHSTQSSCLTESPEHGFSPDRFELLQNYPNPFNPVTSIRYFIPVGTSRQVGTVSLRVFDLLGREVATLLDGILPKESFGQDSGFKSVAFDASGLASGVYLYQLKAGGFVQTRKLMLLR